jgi:hypothetical protein
MEEDIITVNCPEKSGKYKVLQFESDDGSIIRFGQEGDFHSFILRRFAQEIGVKCVLVEGPDDLFLSCLMILLFN